MSKQAQNLERLARERKQAEALWPSLDELHRNILTWNFGEIDRSNFLKGELLLSACGDERVVSWLIVRNDTDE